MSTNQHKLNKATPGTARAALGDVVVELTAKVNELSAQLALVTEKYNEALAKLDLDAGVTGVDYGSTSGATAFTHTAVESIENR